MFSCRCLTINTVMAYVWWASTWCLRVIFCVCLRACARPYCKFFPSYLSWLSCNWLWQLCDVRWLLCYLHLLLSGYVLSVSLSFEYHFYLSHFMSLTWTQQHAFPAHIPKYHYYMHRYQCMHVYNNHEMPFDSVALTLNYPTLTMLGYRTLAVSSVSQYRLCAMVSKQQHPLPSVPFSHTDSKDSALWYIRNSTLYRSRMKQNEYAKLRAMFSILSIQFASSWIKVISILFCRKYGWSWHSHQNWRSSPFIHPLTSKNGWPSPAFAGYS
jgi:hypothetical protein